MVRAWTRSRRRCGTPRVRTRTRRCVDSDIEKKRKKRRRSARVYLSNAHPLPTPEQLAALVDQFPSDEDDDDTSVAKPSVGKRNFDRNVGGGVDRDKIPAKDFAGRHRSFPIVTQEDVSDALESVGRAGEDNYDAATLRRRIIAIARRKGFSVPAEKSTGNPFLPSGRSPAASRVSPSRVTGGASPARDDHGATCDPMAMPGPRELAYGHPSMRQSGTTPVPWATMRERLYDEYGDRAISRGPAGVVGLSVLDAAGAAGMPAFRAEPYANPAARRTDHIAQGSAVPPNGSHSTTGPVQSNAVALKASDRREIMKRFMFPGSTGR